MNIDPATTYQQIGFVTLMAATGRGNGYRVDDDTIGFQVSHGFHVTVTLDAGSDTYTVRRCFRRNGVLKTLGERTWIHCEDLSNTFYDASCFVNVEFGGHRARA